tara:strand:+ start:379 stop:585 length:207 start_codon:yes stop_codon:yes gene_type:complete
LSNLIPELVEKKDPPIITIIKNKNHKLEAELLNEIPILDILLVKEKSIDEKLYSELKKTKNIINKIIK